MGRKYLGKCTSKHSCVLLFIISAPVSLGVAVGGEASAEEAGVLAAAGERRPLPAPLPPPQVPRDVDLHGQSDTDSGSV